MSKKRRQKKFSRIDGLCADLAEEIASLRDDGLGLPLPVELALDDAMEPVFESWEQEVLSPLWTEAVLGVTDVLERQAGTRGNWLLQVTPNADGNRDASTENFRKSLSSDEARASEQTIGLLMQMLRGDTEAWLQGAIKSSLEPLLWALQDGVREMASEQQMLHKPSNVDEQWAYVIRGVHAFFFKSLDKRMPAATAIVVRAVQDGSRGASGDVSSLTASRVRGIVSARSTAGSTG